MTEQEYTAREQEIVYYTIFGSRDATINGVDHSTERLTTTRGNLTDTRKAERYAKRHGYFIERILAHKRNGTYTRIE